MENNRKEVNCLIERRNLTRIFLWISVLLWMVLIFNLSSQAVGQSNALSTEIAKTVVVITEKVAPEKATEIDVRELNHLIRKKSHFLVYLVLGILSMGAVRQSRIYGIKWVVITLLFCSLYAISDEVHQLFVPGRGAQVSDVFIDITGASIGILGYLGINKL